MDTEILYLNASKKIWDTGILSSNTETEILKLKKNAEIYTNTEI